MGLFVEGGAEDGNREMAEVDGAFVNLKPADDTVFAEVFGDARFGNAERFSAHAIVSFTSVQRVRSLCYSVFRSALSSDE